MYRFLFSLLAALTVGLVACQSLYAQTDVPQQPAQTPTRLALEVTSLAGKPPAYQTVRSADSKTPADWYGLFRRVPGWQPQAGALPVVAVSILPRLEGDSVRIAVSVFLGQHHEQEKEIANYLARENEQLIVRELTEFGVEPFELKVVRVAPVHTNLPMARSSVPSLAVVNVEVNDSTLPSCKLTLQNLSGRDVLALGINVLVNGQKQLSATPQGEDGQVLIAAGTTAPLNALMMREAKATPAGYEPATPPQQEIVITAAVFSDGTYEGDELTARKFRAFMAGRKAELGRLLELLQHIKFA